MEETDVMEKSCAVARGKDINPPVIRRFSPPIATCGQCLFKFRHNILFSYASKPVLYS